MKKQKQTVKQQVVQRKPQTTSKAEAVAWMGQKMQKHLYFTPLQKEMIFKTLNFEKSLATDLIDGDRRPDGKEYTSYKEEMEHIINGETDFEVITSIEKKLNVADVSIELTYAECGFLSSALEMFSDIVSYESGFADGQYTEEEAVAVDGLFDYLWDEMGGRHINKKHYKLSELLKSLELQNRKKDWDKPYGQI